MSAGLGHLRLDPRAFWAMTPKELEAALAPSMSRHPPSAALPRAALDHLMRQFPDS